MKVAVYSRVMDENQRQDLQLFFDELKNQRLQPLIFHTYFEQIKIQLHYRRIQKSFILRNT